MNLYTVVKDRRYQPITEWLSVNGDLLRTTDGYF